jgi:hypothetical protein
MHNFWTLYNDAAEFWSDFAETSADTHTTLSHRLNIIAGVDAPSSDNSLQDELDMMVSEKVKAFSEGLLDAGWQAGMFYMNSAFRQPDVTSFTRAVFSISKAGLDPVRRTVKSNADRLSAPKPAKTS